MMKRLFLVVVALMAVIGCGSNGARTAREAVKETCDLLMEGEYDVVLDRMAMFRAPAEQDQLMAWAEQQSSAMIKAMMCVRSWKQTGIPFWSELRIIMTENGL